MGPLPEHLIIAEQAKPPASRQPHGNDGDVIKLWAVDTIKGHKAAIRESKKFDRGLGGPVFQTDRSGRRLIWATSSSSGSQIEVVTLDWNEQAGGALVRAAPTSVLGGTQSTEKIFNVQTAAIAPNGGYAVISADVRGRSGTQFGFGTLDSWSLFALDRKHTTLVPESTGMPISQGRHAAKIAYAHDSRRIAVLDVTGGVTIFKVRAAPIDGLSAPLVTDEDVVRRLHPDVHAIEKNSATWVATYSANDQRLYDLTEGRETKLLLPEGCGEALRAERNGYVNLVSAGCAMQLEHGKVIRLERFAESAKSALIGSDLITVRLTDRVMFLSATDLSLIASANLAANPFLNQAISDFLSPTSDPSGAPYLPTLAGTDGAIELLHLTDDRNLEKWTSSRLKSPSSAVFSRSWSQPVPKRGWSSVRRIPEADLILALFGNYSGDAPTLLQIRASDGAILTKFGVPATKSSLMEVAAAGALDTDGLYGVFRLYPRGLGLVVWPREGGPPRTWFQVAEQDTFTKDDVAAIQHIGDDALVIVRVGFEENAKLRAYSVRSGQQVWERRTDRLLPAPPLMWTRNGWQVVSDVALTAATGSVLSGGGGIFDHITALHLSTEQIEQLKNSPIKWRSLGDSAKIAVQQ
jgi:hypothetical protein